MLHSIFAWLKTYESLGIWLEAIALVALFGLDFDEYRKQGKERLREHEETAAQMDIFRRQIHADRVAEIFKSLRRFEHFLVDAVSRSGKFGPGKDYSEFGDVSKGGAVFEEYLDLQEAYYLSYLVSDQLASFMKLRMLEADGLQKISNPVEFNAKYKEFLNSWDAYKLAVKFRELS